jgi:hypothetical protein
MARVPDRWLIDGFFDGLTLVLPAAIATGPELVPDPAGEIQINGQTCSRVDCTVVRSLSAVQRTDTGVILRLAPVPEVTSRQWDYPPLSLLEHAIELTRERGGFDADSALAALAGDELSRRDEWDVASPLHQVPHPDGTIWLLNFCDLGFMPGGLTALVDFGKGRACSVTPAAGFDWARLSLVPVGQAPAVTLCDDGLPLPARR